MSVTADHATPAPAPEVCPPLTAEGAAFQRTVFAIEAWPESEPMTVQCWHLLITRTRPERY